jgi:hypothetical protein
MLKKLPIDPFYIDFYAKNPHFSQILHRKPPKNRFFAEFSAKFEQQSAENSAEIRKRLTIEFENRFQERLRFVFDNF